jgi:hypothetical protein
VTAFIELDILIQHKAESQSSFSNEIKLAIRLAKPLKIL